MSALESVHPGNSIAHVPSSSVADGLNRELSGAVQPAYAHPPSSMLKMG